MDTQEILKYMFESEAMFSQAYDELCIDDIIFINEDAAVNYLEYLNRDVHK